MMTVCSTPRRARLQARETARRPGRGGPAGCCLHGWTLCWSRPCAGPSPRRTCGPPCPETRPRPRPRPFAGTWPAPWCRAAAPRYSFGQKPVEPSQGHRIHPVDVPGRRDVCPEWTNLLIFRGMTTPALRPCSACLHRRRSGSLTISPPKKRPSTRHAQTRFAPHPRAAPYLDTPSPFPAGRYRTGALVCLQAGPAPVGRRQAGA